MIFPLGDGLNGLFAIIRFLVNVTIGAGAVGTLFGLLAAWKRRSAHGWSLWVLSFFATVVAQLGLWTLGFWRENWSWSGLSLTIAAAGWGSTLMMFVGLVAMCDLHEERRQERKLRRPGFPVIQQKRPGE